MNKRTVFFATIILALLAGSHLGRTQQVQPATPIHGIHGILPGEPNPNHFTAHPERECPKGTHRVQKMECQAPGHEIKCQTNYHVVLICRKKSMVLHCKKPKIAKPVYGCN